MTKKELQYIRDRCDNDDDFLEVVWMEMEMPYYISGIYCMGREVKKRYAEQRYKFEQYMARYNLYNKSILFRMYKEIEEFKEIFKQ